MDVKIMAALGTSASTVSEELPGGQRDRRSDAISTLGGLFVTFIVCFVFFGLAIARSATFDWVEGDDATTVLYHVMKGAPPFPRPFAAYQGMIDRWLDVLPDRLALQKRFIFGLSALFTPMAVWLALAIAFEWLREGGFNPNITTIGLASAVVLLSIPEVFFLSLAFEPIMVGLTLIFLGHLLLRKFVLTTTTCVDSSLRRYSLITLAGVLFGLGVSFRWDTALYGIVIVVDILVPMSISISMFRTNWRTRTFPGLRVVGVWALAAAVSMSFFVLWGAGTLENVLGAFHVAGSVAAGHFRHTNSGLGLLVGYSMLLTPGLLASLAIGTVVWRRTKLLVLPIVIVLIYSPILRNGCPKNLMPILPLLLGLSLGGVLWFVGRGTLLGARLGGSLLAVLLLVPWIIGLEVEMPGTQWGPGFEVTEPPRRPTLVHDEGIPFKIGIFRAAIVPSSGVAVPTMEGVRPVWGWGWALLEGGWRGFYRRWKVDSDKAIEFAAEKEMAILSIRGSGSVKVARLLELGFQRAGYQKHNQLATCDITVFKRPDGRELKFIRLVSSWRGQYVEAVRQIMQELSETRLVVLSETSVIRSLVDTWPGHYRVLSPWACALAREDGKGSHTEPVSQKRGAEMMTQRCREANPGGSHHFRGCRR